MELKDERENNFNHIKIFTLAMSIKIQDELLVRIEFFHSIHNCIIIFQPQARPGYLANRLNVPRPHLHRDIDIPSIDPPLCRRLIYSSPLSHFLSFILDYCLRTSLRLRSPFRAPVGIDRKYKDELDDPKYEKL